MLDIIGKLVELWSLHGLVQILGRLAPEGSCKGDTSPRPLYLRGAGNPQCLLPDSHLCFNFHVDYFLCVFLCLLKTSVTGFKIYHDAIRPYFSCASTTTSKSP